MNGSKVALSFLSTVIVMTLTFQTRREYIAALVKIKCLLSPPAHVAASVIPTGAQTYVSGITDINI